MSTNQLDAQSAELQEDQGGPWVGAPRSALLMIEEGGPDSDAATGSSFSFRRHSPPGACNAAGRSSMERAPISPSPRALLAGTTRSFVWLCSDAPRADWPRRNRC